ncbi:ComF family protein [Neobacillus sp. LXY-4]|uniref:ComF family protein n=1 Tax=Neobacillus sp. LXY-4 TaxID=3379826 RepID=UPI003EE08F3F
MNNLFRPQLCVICHQEITGEFGWVQLFSKESNTQLCQTCNKKLLLITGETCQICGRSFENGEYSYRKGQLCFDCTRWEDDPEWHNLLHQNISLFKYNDFLKETLSTFKYRGDYMIAHAFTDFIKIKLKPLGQTHLLVPIPLSSERLYERGFNQAEALIKEAGFTPSPLLARIHTEKQSKKSRSDRIHLPQVFSIIPETAAVITGQSILLIDDIYTTGSTLRHAAKILKKAGAGTISSFTLARG